MNEEEEARKVALSFARAYLRLHGEGQSVTVIEVELYQAIRSILRIKGELLRDPDEVRREYPNMGGKIGWGRGE